MGLLISAHETSVRGERNDCHNHDTRHEGITRLSRRLPILALARAVGHRDLRMLQIYYNESGENLAKMLD